MKEIQSNFDYMICGGGMAGLSLAYYLSVSEKLQNKRILIIEPTIKNKNDRTWAFWEKGTTKLEEIVFRKWENVTFVSPENEARQIDLNGYAYKLIRGIDFYEFTHKKLVENKNVVFLQDYAVAITDTEKKAIVTTKNNGTFTANWAFDSTFKLDLTNSKNHNLLQHFKGFIIKTERTIATSPNATVVAIIVFLFFHNIIMSSHSSISSSYLVISVFIFSFIKLSTISLF